MRRQCLIKKVILHLFIIYLILHLGPKKKLKAVSNLLDSLDECDQYAQSSHQKQVFITGRSL